MSSPSTLTGSDVVGKISMADRVIFKGHLNGLYPDGAFASFLLSQGILLKNFDGFARNATEKLKTHLQSIAKSAGRTYMYLERAHTHASKKSKEDIAREIAENEKITEGLICILATVEPCVAFTVRGNHKTQRLDPSYIRHVL